MSEESDRMIVLLQELAVLRKVCSNGKKSFVTKKRRKQISAETKQLASQRRRLKNVDSR